MALLLTISTVSAADLLSLNTWVLRVKGAEVDLLPAVPGEGDQGAGWDFLTVAISSGGIGMAVLRTIQAWLESRRSSLRIRVNDGGSEREIELDASNVEDVMPILKKMLDG